MNLINRMMISESNLKLNIDGSVKGCECKECTNPKVENQTVEYPSLTEEEIEQIIKERYDYKDEKTKTFIRKALRKHGNRYDYSNVVYIKATINVEIICRVEGHKPFSMTPNNHLRGENCKQCGYEKLANERKLTFDEFVKNSNRTHGIGRYDYSKVVYVNNNVEVIIICHNHDEPYEFKQKPKHHMNGHGCKKCADEKLAIEKLKSIDLFIKEANEVHGFGTYDYSKVEYVDTHTEVIIICPKHGPFPQEPSNHLSGQGCPKCNKNKGEEAVRKFLTEKGIEFEEQKKFEGCEYKRKLKFDFYLPKYNLCIESDGNVHFEKINWSGKMTNEEMEENLKLSQIRDNIKNEYCKNNGIGLLRVNNRKVYEELTEYFQNHNINE